MRRREVRANRQQRASCGSKGAPPSARPLWQRQGFAKRSPGVSAAIQCARFTGRCGAVAETTAKLDFGEEDRTGNVQGRWSISGK